MLVFAIVGAVASWRLREDSKPATSESITAEVDALSPPVEWKTSPAVRVTNTPPTLPTRCSSCQGVVTPLGYVGYLCESCEGQSALTPARPHEARQTAVSADVFAPRLQYVFAEDRLRGAAPVTAANPEEFPHPSVKG